MIPTYAPAVALAFALIYGLCMRLPMLLAAVCVFAVACSKPRDLTLTYFTIPG